MKIHSVRLKNYKSFGNKNNEIIFDKDITTIIGKNESGKSNLVEGLSHISVMNSMDAAFNKNNLNRNMESNENISYEIILKPKEKLSLKTSKEQETILILDKENQNGFGSILTYFKEYHEQTFLEFYNSLKENPFELKGESLRNYANILDKYVVKDNLDFKSIRLANNYFDALFVQKKNTHPELFDLFDVLKNSWLCVTNKIPQIFFSDHDKVLKPSYSHKELSDLLTGVKPDNESLIPNLLSLINISKEDFLEAVKPGMEPRQSSIRAKISDNIDSIINKDFSDFYKTEKIKLNIEFNTNLVGFNVKSNDGMTLPLKERSNGLRWYINTFIDSRSQGITNTNVLYIFDEPGISLHVNAQKSLLTFFEDLTFNGNQVVYTTHSPFMINVATGIRSIRPVIKSQEGYTSVFKTAYDHRITSSGGQETLTPIIKAVGMSVSDTFGPSQRKLNVITEGVSDYLYLNAIFKNLNVEVNKFNIIPSFGVSSSINIANILEGWGCPFALIFDFDKEGVTSGGDKLTKSHLYEYKKDFLYINDPEQSKITERDYINNPFEIEDLIGKEQFKKFDEGNLYVEKGKISKTLLAKIFSDKLNNKEIELTDEVKRNFISLHKQLNLICDLKLC